MSGPPVGLGEAFNAAIRQLQQLVRLLCRDSRLWSNFKIRKAQKMEGELPLGPRYFFYIHHIFWIYLLNEMYGWRAYSVCNLSATLSLVAFFESVPQRTLT